MKPLRKKRRVSKRAKHYLYLGDGEFVHHAAVTPGQLLKHAAMILREVPKDQQEAVFTASFATCLKAQTSLLLQLIRKP